MAIDIWVNIGPGHGLMPDGTKILPELISISEVTWYSPESTFISLKIKNKLLKLLPHIPWAN